MELLENSQKIAGRGCDISQKHSPGSNLASDFPQSSEEAQLHIERIREQKMSVYGKNKSSDIEAALKLISGDLYQNSMHFLFELLQNSDDNEYQDSYPMIKITYRDRSIRFDTNEVGFRRRDVEAICSIGNSFKKKSDQRNRRIGEKGIGFKSVFRVSETVFINSGYYSFKFTSSEPLGMLAPIPSPFPGVIIPGHTSIVLQLRPDVNVDELISGLKQLDGRILMFLQRLKRVELKILTADDSNTEVVLQRNLGSAEVPIDGEICDVEPDDASPYLISRHTASRLPGEERRKGWNESEIVLAFSIGIWNGGSLAGCEKPNNVFSFLPIRDYGFKFVLHADFILVSSREEIDPESEWNKSLRSHVPVAFLRSLAKLRDSKLRYTWPYYIPMKQKIENFFRDLWLETSNLLSQHPILESVQGTLSLPSALCLVPKEFAGLDGRPLIPSDASKFTYISSSYPAETWDALKSLGVKILAAEDFLDDLSHFIEAWPDRFQSIPTEWHSCLAKVLDPLVTEYEDRIMALRFIQLRDGTLVSPDSGNLLFTTTLDNLVIPEQIGALVVHDDINNDHSRRILLQKLGAQIPDKTAVCRIILETHSSNEFIPEVIKIHNLVEHAVFLRKAGWDSFTPEDALWVVAEDGSCHHGYSLYLGSNDPYSAKQLLNQCNRNSILTKGFLFIHAGYSSFFVEHEDRRWLRKTLEVSEVPRLACWSEQSATYTMDPGFKLLLNYLRTKDLLQMLKVNWSHYQEWIVFKSSQDADGNTQPDTEPSTVNDGNKRNHGLDISLLSKELKRLVSEVTVSCWDGSTKLCRTCLPRESVLRDLNIPGSRLINHAIPTNQESTTQAESDVSVALFPVLDIRDPEDPAWDFLQNFGVIVKVTAKELVIRLENLQERPITSRILRIYEQIQACAVHDGESLRRNFNDKKLVYIPEECAVQLQGPRWLSLDSCVWDGPTCLKKFPRLRSIYPRLENLFCSKLKLAAANLNTLIAEAMLINTKDSLTYIRSLFKQLSHMSYGTYYHTRHDAKLYDLLDMNIFPVWTGKRGAQFDQLRGSRMSWYIADAPYLLDSFEGELPLLAFEPSMLGEIRDLVSHLGWENRKLRKLAGKEMSIEGSERLDYKYTQSLQEKWRCISRLVPTDRANGATIISQLRSIQVFEAESICVTWKVTNTDGETFIGSPEKGRAMIAAHDGLLKLYLAKEDTKIGCPPLELIDELAAFCGIETSEHVRLLGHILVQNDIQRIELDLDRCNVPYLAMDFDLPASGTYRAPDIPDTAQPNLQQVSDMPASSAPSPYPNFGLVSLSMPVLAASQYRQVEEIKFTAELYVAGALAQVMGSDFVEQQHWTSYLRSRAGHKPYDPEDPRVSTFTFLDTNKQLTRFLTDKGYYDAISLSDDPIYHIQVVHSLGPIGSMFHINSNQVEKARLLSQAIGSTTKRKEVFILAYVYNIFNSLEVALYPDPWHLYATGLLSIETSHDQEGRLNKGAPAVHMESSVRPLGSTSRGAKTARFKYRDLKPREIRILDLSPGKDNEPLKGVIRSVPISHAGRFRAISYVWGVSPNEISPYYLFTPQGTVLLNFSLHSTFRAIRGDSTVSVWADGICINQKNSWEKALQIGMLGEIFQAAEQVTAWLGHAYRGSDDAMRVLSQIQTQSYHDQASRVTTTMNSLVSGSATGKVPDPGDVTWEHINSLLRRPWFTRVWITQELVLPRKVVLLCGQSELDWDQFFEALVICERESNRVSRQSPDDIQLLPDAGPAYALGIARKQRKEGKLFRLLKLLEIFEYAEASIERDKLFAFLGLARDSTGEEFMPDYESTLEEVVRRYSKGFIRRGYVMELLYRAGSSKSYEFCSWIPRWTQGQFPKTISTWDAQSGPFRAGTPSAPIVTYTRDQVPQCIIVDGYVVDTIRSAHRIKWGSGSSLFFFDAMIDFKSLLSFVDQYPTGESTEDLLLRLPIGNATRPHLESDVDKERSYRAFATREHYTWPPNLRELILSVDNDQDPSKYLHMSRHNQQVIAQYWQTVIAFSNRLGNAGFCFTKGGYVGLVPEAAVAGDQICLFHGSKVPFVVREKGQAYTLVGECYIHGIMNGEALQWDGSENHSLVLV